MIILRTVQSDTSCTNVEQSLFMQIVNRDRIFPETEFALVHLSCEEATVFVHRRVL